MHIKSPLVAYKEVVPLCQAGATELFCGFEPLQWRALFPGLCLSQRSGRAGFQKLADLEKAVIIAHRHSCKVHVAFNAFFYHDTQYRQVARFVRQVFSIGADGVILADPTAVSLVRREVPVGKDLIAGTDALVFNSAAAAFYQQLGATRAVLPRSMRMEEIHALTQAAPTIEFEAFIIHDLCFFEDGLCAFCKEQWGEGRVEKGLPDKKINFLVSGVPLQRGFMTGCRSKYKRLRKRVSDGYLLDRRTTTFWPKRHIEGCGACALWYFRKWSLASVKILDRNMPLLERVKTTGFIAQCCRMLEQGMNKETYMYRSKRLFRKTFRVACRRTDCYYPDA